MKCDRFSELVRNYSQKYTIAQKFLQLLRFTLVRVLLRDKNAFIRISLLLTLMGTYSSNFKS